MKNLQKNIPDSSDPSQQVAKDKKSNINLSQHYQQYCQATKDVRLKYQDEVELIEKSMKTKLRKMNHEFKITMAQEIRNKQGQFIMTAHLLNIQVQIFVMVLDQNSPFTNSQQHQSGAFGKVCSLQLLDKHIAVKTYPFTSKGQDCELIWSKEVQMAIKQFAFISLSGKVKCGPNCDLCFLPNILIFNNEIQLFMERCEPISSYTPRDYEDLLANLLHLHTLGIVHNDITPSNIMYSTIQNKLVFIDYGFSQILIEKLGQKTLTSFQGTAQYVSADMLKLFSIDDKKQYIDLYYNDLVALQNTNKYLQKHFDSLNKEDNQMEAYNLKDKIMAIYEDEQDECQNSERKLFYHFVMLILCIPVGHKPPKTFNKYKKAVYKKYGHKILIILSNVASQQTLKKYLFQQLSQLSYLGSYQDLYKSMSLRACRTKFMCGYTPILFLNSTFYDPLSQQNKLVIKQGKNISASAIKQFSIKTLQQIQLHYQDSNKGIYLALLMNTLRFDVKDEIIQFKSNLANKFLKVAKINYQQQLTNKPEYSIQIAIKYSLNYFLTHFCIINSWELILHTMTQAIIVNTDIRTQLDQLNQILKNKQYSIKSSLVMTDGLFFLLKFFEMKYTYSSRNVLREINIKLSLCITVLQQKLIDKCIESTQKEHKVIGMIFFQLNKGRCLQVQQLQILAVSVRKISDQNIVDIIEKRLLQLEINFLKTFVLKQIQHKWIFSIKQYLSQVLWTTSWKFSQVIYWRYTLASQEQDLVQLQEIQAYLYNSIICSFRASQFVSFFRDNSTFLFTTAQLVTKIKQFLEHCFEDDNFYLFEKQFQCLLIYLSNDTLLKEVKVYFFTQIIQKVISKLNVERQLSPSYLQNRIQRNHFLEVIPTLFYFIRKQHQPQFLKLIESLEQLMESLYWKLLEEKAINGQWSQYQCYLVYLYYQLKHLFHYTIENDQQQPKYYLKFKQQLQILTKLPFRNRQDLFQTAYICDNWGQLEFYNSRLQTPQLKQKAMFLSKIASWVLKYCSYKDEYHHFFRHSNTKQFRTIYTILVYLKTQGQQFGKEVQFLQKVIHTLSMIPSNQNISFFQQNICKFYHENTTLDIDQMINKKILQWNERYFLLLYALALNVKRRKEKQLRYLSIIARNIYMHTWVSKQLILYLYYQNILNMNNLNTSNPRKRKYVIRHHYGTFQPKQGNFYRYHQKQCNKEMVALCGLKKKKLNCFKRIFKDKLEK